MMRFRFQSIAVFLLMVSICRADDLPAQCANFPPKNQDEVAELAIRIAHADIEALKESRVVLDCVRVEDVEVLARATGEFFDAHPREYLQKIADLAPQDIRFVESLAFPPARLGGD